MSQCVTVNNVSKKLLECYKTVIIWYVTESH